jgi:hypothetical protein
VVTQHDARERAGFSHDAIKEVNANVRQQATQHRCDADARTRPNANAYAERSSDIRGRA